MANLEQIRQLRFPEQRWKPTRPSKNSLSQELYGEDSETEDVWNFVQPMSLNGKLQLLIRQIQLHLPVEPILEAEPELAELANEVVTNIPKILHRTQPIQLHQPILARLQSNCIQTCIEVHINQGVHKGGYPKLFEWGLRSPDLTWRDEVKLWATTKYLRCDPDNLYLAVLALRRHDIPQAQLHRWSLEQQQNTETWLIETFENPYTPFTSSIAPPTEDLILPDFSKMTIAEYLETIPEVVI